MNRRILIQVVTIFCLASCASPAHKKEVMVKSPDENLSMIFHLDEDGIHYSILAGKDSLISHAPFHLDIENTELNFNGPLEITNISSTSKNDHYKMISGKKSVYEDHYREKDVTLKNEEGNLLHVQVRAYNDGVAMRQKIKHKGNIKVEGENTLFKIPDMQDIFILTKSYREYEGLYAKRNLKDISSDEVLLFPALFNTRKGYWCLLSEAATFENYPGVQLRKSEQESGTLRTILPQDNFVVSDSLLTPWRAFIIGKNLKTIVESTLIENLNPPSKIENTSWITPGVATFPWWSDHFVSGNETALKKFVDMASDMGWEWIEFDVALVGTNQHTTREWLTTDWVPEFVQYAHDKGIKVYGWDERKVLDTPEKRAFIFQKYKEYGIDGIKVDFIDSDKLDAMRFRTNILRDAAKYQLMVSFHGETLPRGQRRTWPNLMTQEAVRGAEYYTFPKVPSPNPVHNTILPFTRNVVGPMDYTPTTFTAKERRTSYAHELALAFIFESGWVAMADSPEAYLESPGREILTKIEGAWDDFHYIDGSPGEYVVLARKKKNTWIIAGINSDQSRKVTIDLDFLDKKIDTIKLYTDGSDDRLSVTELPVQDKEIEIEIIPNGGFVFAVE